MTAKEKATELYSKYHTPLIKYRDNLNIQEVLNMQNCAKQCAIIAADELADECNKYFEAISSNRVNYWTAVKAEIEKL